MKLPFSSGVQSLENFSTLRTPTSAHFSLWKVLGSFCEDHVPEISHKCALLLGLFPFSPPVVVIDSGLSAHGNKGVIISMITGNFPEWCLGEHALLFTLCLCLTDFSLFCFACLFSDDLQFGEMESSGDGSGDG